MLAISKLFETKKDKPITVGKKETIVDKDAVHNIEKSVTIDPKGEFVSKSTKIKSFGCGCGI